MADRYQKEIEEILKRVEQVPPKRKPLKGGRPFLRALGQKLGGLLGGGRLSPGKLMLLGLLLLLSSLFLRGRVPGMVGPVAWTGLALLVVSYALFFMNPTSYEKRWRGKVVDYRTSLWYRLRRWLGY